MIVKKVIPTAELAINSFLNQSTGFSPFYFNYGNESVTSIQPLQGNQQTTTESVAFFVGRVNFDWGIAKEN